MPVYAAGGYYYPQDSAQRLTDELKGYRDQGYHAFKIKIGGAPLDQDLARIHQAIEVAGAASAVAVDANGRFDREDAMAYGAALEPLGLRWYEEPGDPLDFELNRALTSTFGGVVATGENLFSCADVANLARYGGMRPGVDVFQHDPGLSYGLSHYLLTLQALTDLGFERSQCIPHGGHLINLHIVTALGLGGCEAYPGVFQPFGGYSAECRLAEGRISASDAPGFGLEQKAELRPWLGRILEDI